MKTTCSRPATYLGVDLTDAYCKAPRPIDVCGLDARGATLEARFWTWSYVGGTADGDRRLWEVRAASRTALDGPHALARRGQSQRACERLLRAPGKTPAELPAVGRPFAGFVRSSVELFAAFASAGVGPAAADGAPFAGPLIEVYPGGNWSRLVQGLGERLPAKNTPRGQARRRVILEALGVVFEQGAAVGHDRLDACLAAVIAAAASGALADAETLAIGTPLEVDENGTAREGPIFVLSVGAQLRETIASALRGPSDVHERRR